MYNIKTVRMYSINHIPIRVPRHIYMSIIPRKGYAKRLRRSTVKHSQKKTPHQSKNRHVRIENKNQASKPAETVELLFSNRGAFVETPRPLPHLGMAGKTTARPKECPPIGCPLQPCLQMNHDLDHRQDCCSLARGHTKTFSVIHVHGP